MTAYYNEIDPYAAQWLRNLIDAGHIAPGVVDERSITDVQPDDLDGFTQCHFFAGIGGWSHALRLAGWPDDRPVWTGSCPCQPFSVAGRGAGVDDERHLWPTWQRLIAQCRPAVIFGEQVDAAIRHGWLDLVQSDMEAQGYAFAPVGLPAAGVGAPHIRQRLWFVAHPIGEGLEGYGGHGDDSREPGRLSAQPAGSTGPGGRVGALADPCSFGREWGKNPRQPSAENTAKWCEGMPNAECRSNAGSLADPSLQRRDGVVLRLQQGRPRQGGSEIGRDGEAGALADPCSAGVRSERLAGAAGAPGPDGPGAGQQRVLADAGAGRASAGDIAPTGGPLDGFWATADWVFCRDGKWRPVEPGTQPLAHGVPARVGRLRAYGNAIVPQVAAALIQEAAHWLDTVVAPVQLDLVDWIELRVEA